MTEKNHEKIAIRVSNLHKTFRIPLEGGNNLKQRIVNFTRHKKGYREFSPLNGVSFEIKKGEFFGIVGRNGSGKSTLLKTIAGIYQPNSGDVKVNGKLVPFIELGVGFNPELTGRENTYLNGALLGFSRDEMTDMYDDIVDFAELHDFMDERLKNYSSGMQVRLAFSIAIRAKGDILLLDEVLAVGDSAFQQKCYDYFRELKNNNRTVVLVTHSMSAVQKFCNRALLLEDGRIKQIGESAEIADEYDHLFIREDRIKRQEKSKSEKVAKKKPVIEFSAEVYQNGKLTTEVIAKQEFTIKVGINSQLNIKEANIIINIKDVNSNVLCAVGTEQYIPKLGVDKSKKLILDFVVENIFTDGNYTVNIGVDEITGETRKLIEKEPGVASFSVIGTKYHKASLTHPGVEVSIS